MKLARIFPIALFCWVGAVSAQDTVSVTALRFQGIFASKADDPRTYILLGGGWLRVIQFGNPDEFIANWLAAHPTAIATPISKMIMTNMRNKKEDQLVNIWVDDGESSLNVDLVRAGVFPGGVMHDMVDYDNYLTKQMQDPQLAGAKKEIEKERAEMPQDKPVRIVADVDYDGRLHRIEEAEAAARNEKLGI